MPTSFQLAIVILCSSEFRPKSLCALKTVSNAKSLKLDFGLRWLSWMVSYQIRPTFLQIYLFYKFIIDVLLHVWQAPLHWKIYHNLQGIQIEVHSTMTHRLSHSFFKVNYSRDELTIVIKVLTFYWPSIIIGWITVSTMKKVSILIIKVRTRSGIVISIIPMIY